MKKDAHLSPRDISLKRARELSDYTTDYRAAKAHIAKGTDQARIDSYEA